jgi:hypothetical protein
MPGTATATMSATAPTRRPLRASESVSGMPLRRADGLAERAQKVDSPDLARTATSVAILANEFVGTLSRVRAQAESRAPGAPAPPAAYEMAALNARISNNLAELEDACS